MTRNQLLVQSKMRRRPKTKLNRTPALAGNPQKKAICVKIITRAPKKPNSAVRKVAKVRLGSKSKRVDISRQVRVESYIPGEGHNLQEYSLVLLRGGRVPDLPGVKYHCIRGVYDFKGLDKRRQARSLYGAKKPGKRPY